MIDTKRIHTPGAPVEHVDAYKTLHVAPSAPYELIEQAYWILVARARRERSGELRLGQLNDAYATLINPERRTAYDAEHNLTKQRTRGAVVTAKRSMFRRSAPPTTQLTHYQLLDVDPEASKEIVDLAYAHRKFKMRGSDDRALHEQQLVEDAYLTLAHDERRAAYDQRVMAMESSVASVEAAAAIVAPAAKRTVIAHVEPPRPVLKPEPVEAAPVPPAPVAETEADAAPSAAPSAVVETPVAAAPVEEPAVDNEPPVALPPRPTHVSESPKADVEPAPADDTPEVAAAAVAAAVVVSEPGERLGARFRKLFARKEAVDAEPKADRHALAAETERAENLRLAALGVTAVAPEPVVSREPDWPAGVRAQFRVTSGPQIGEVIHLTNNSVILGASDAADVRLSNPDGMIGAGHVRVWRREDEFILHQLDSFTTTYVNGERLDLRLAILEAGDEIRIGPHTLVYDQSVAPASEQATV